jgi:hypothetical protein
MYASGSTWLYNTTRDVAGQLYPEAWVNGAYAEGMEALTRLPPGLNVVKTHHLPRPAGQFLHARADRILLSLRDPRDAVTSLMQHMGQSFLQALHWAEESALFCARHAGDARATLFIYETGFTEAPGTLDLLAAALGGTLPAAARAALFTSTRREAIEAKIATLEALPTSWRNPANGDLVDTDTQWHRHHAGRSGEVGRWRRLMPPEGVAVIERRLGGFMREFGYR